MTDSYRTCQPDTSVKPIILDALSFHFTHLDIKTSTVSNVLTRFAFLPLVWFPLSLGFIFWIVPEKVAATLVEVCPHSTKANRPQHVANPNTSMQRTTVGLAGMHDPKQLTVHTESGEVRHGHKNTGKENLGEERVNDYVHSLNPVWTVMSGFGELINTKHTVWLRAVMIDYLANCSCAVSICPIFKIQYLCQIHQYTVTFIFIFLSSLFHCTFIKV